MRYLRNPRNLIPLSGHPTEKIGDRGDRTELYLGARLMGCTATQRSKKVSQKVLGRVVGKSSERGASYGFCSQTEIQNWSLEMP